MSLTAVLGFAAVALALIVVPGPDWAYVLAAGARDHVVAPAVAGLMAGYLLITAVIAAGVGPLITTLPPAMIVLTLAGAGYLTYLGIRILRGGARVERAEPAGAVAVSPGRSFVRGVGVSALNPKGLLIFLSILPQFARERGGWPLWVQLAVLGGVFVLIVAAFYFPLGYAADRVLGARPRVAHLTARVAGVAMVLVGVALLAERALALAGVM